MKIIAHRCGDSKFPEATIDSALYSMSKDIKHLEIDIRFTIDNVPVICHDPDLKRAFGIDKNVSELVYKEFKELNYLSNSDYHPYSFEDFMEAGIGTLLIDVKEGDHRLDQIIKLIDKWNYYEKVILGVRTVNDLLKVKQYKKNLKVLGFIKETALVDTFISEGADIIRLWEKWVDTEKITLIKNRGKEVWVMCGQPYDGSVGIIEDEKLEEIIRKEVDGVIINDVDQALRILELCYKSN